jgi:pantothenate kinase type III
MLLALDVGNTTTTLAPVLGGEPGTSRSAATRPAATADELELLIEGLLGLDGQSLAGVEEIVAASVVPAISAVSSGNMEPL